MASRLAQATALLPWMVEHRRHLHQHPEVGLELPDTHAYVRSALEDLGLDCEEHRAAGITVRIPGSDSATTPVVLRADMDALPLRERTGLSFASRRDGAMHACGHDLHMGILLGVARALVSQAPKRDVVLTFQPGEESDRGAVRTLQHSNLDLASAEAFAVHVHATLPTQSINCRPGVFMAFGEWFQADFSGPGAHASQPHLAGNPVEAGARFVLLVKGLVDSMADDEDFVATVTESQIGNTVNVIPTHGRVRGTIRTLSDGRRQQLIAGLESLAHEAAAQTDTGCEFQLIEGYPAVVNSPSVIDQITQCVQAGPLASHVSVMERPSMVIEDFAYFLQRWEGAMVYVGARLPGRTAFNHAADADFDEAALATGAALHLWAADGWTA